MGEIRFVDTGETHGYPYLVCKKLLSSEGINIFQVFWYSAILQHCVQMGKKQLLWNFCYKFLDLWCIDALPCFYAAFKVGKQHL